MPAIILDRDGVINHESHEYIKSPEEWHPIPGSLDAIATLNRAGFDAFIVTNQSGIGRGLYDLETLDLIHEKLMNELAKKGGFVREIFFCPHHPDEACACRKPAPGLFKKLTAKYPLALHATFFIGDSYGDICAAWNAGCKPLLVKTGNGEKVLANYPEITNKIPVFQNLSEAVPFIITAINQGYQNG